MSESKPQKSREALNKYVKALHDARNELSISVFHAYGIYESLTEVPLIKAPLPWSDILDVSQKDLDSAEDILREVRDNSNLFLKRANHPLRGMKPGGVDLSTQERLEDHLRKLVSFCEFVNFESRKLLRLFKRLDFSSVGTRKTSTSSAAI